MRLPTRFITTFVATSLTLSTSLHAAHADDPSATDIAAARDLGKEGVLLANDGKCAEAVDKLQRAEKLFHAPTILGRLGECQVSLGKIVEGTENLQRVVHEPLTSSSPPAYVAAVERAQKVLALARPRIAKLTINVTAPADVSARVTIDGELVSSGLIGGARPTNPGVHTVEAIATGYRSAKAQVTLADGATSSVTLTIDTRDDGAAVGPALVPTTTPTVAPKVDGPVPVPVPRESDRSTSTGATRLPAYVALGMGGLGLVTSVTFGLLALDGKARLDGTCTDKHCPPSSGSDLDRTRRFAAVSTVGFGVAVVGGVLGATLLFTRSEPTHTASATSFRVSPAIGFGSFALVGSF